MLLIISKHPWVVLCTEIVDYPLDFSDSFLCGPKNDFSGVEDNSLSRLTECWGTSSTEKKDGRGLMKISELSQGL